MYVDYSCNDITNFMLLLYLPMCMCVCLCLCRNWWRAAQAQDKSVQETKIKSKLRHLQLSDGKTTSSFSQFSNNCMLRTCQMIAYAHMLGSNFNKVEIEYITNSPITLIIV